MWEELRTKNRKREGEIKEDTASQEGARREEGKAEGCGGLALLWDQSVVPKSPPRPSHFLITFHCLIL